MTSSAYYGDWKVFDICFACINVSYCGFDKFDCRFVGCSIGITQYELASGWSDEGVKWIVEVPSERRGRTNGAQGWGSV
jgi:hypothetical protein